MSKIKYKMGDEVAHIDSLLFKMRVRQVVYIDKKLSHIVCDWVDKDVRKEANFHSKELILFSIAEKGKEYVESYIKMIDFDQK